MQNTANRTGRELNTTGRAFTHVNPTRRLLLKMGGACGVAGALLALVANSLHPHPNDSRLEALFLQIAQNQSWVIVHLTLIFGLVLTCAALLALTLTTSEEPAASISRMAGLATILGGTLILVSTAGDGFAMNLLTRAWSEAAPGEKATAFHLTVAIDNLQYAIYSLSIVFFLGVAIFLYGLSMILSRAYPKVLGWLAMLSGAGAFAVGIAQTFGGPTFRDIEIFFVIFSGLTTLWLLVMGVQMWRKADAETSNEI